VQTVKKPKDQKKVN